MSIIIVPDDQATLAAAILAANTGDTIQLRAGTHTANSLNNGTADNLIIEPHPDNAAAVILDGGGGVSTAINQIGLNWTIRGSLAYPMRFQNYSTGGIYGVLHGAFPNGSQFHVQDVEITDGERGISHISGNSVVRRVVISGTAGYPVLSNNNVDYHQCRIIGASGLTAMSLGAVGNRVSHCVVKGVNGTGIGAGGTSHEVFNSIVYGGGGAYGIQTGSGGDHRFNAVFGSWTTAAIGGHHGAHPTDRVLGGSDPFVDEAGGDFHLDPPSALIGGGMWTELDVGEFDAAGAAWGVSPQYSLKGVTLDGVDEHVVMPAALAALLVGNGGHTFSAWVKGVAMQSGDAIFVRHDSGANHEITIQSSTGGVLSVYTSTFNIFGSHDVTDGHWHHIVVVFDEDNDEVTAYVDGKLDAGPEAIPGSYDHLAASDIIRIGYDWDGGDPTIKSLDAKVAQATFWARKFTADDVAELFAWGAPEDPAGHSQASTLVGHYKLGDGDTHPTATDAKNGNNGTYTNTEAGDLAAITLPRRINIGLYATPYVDDVAPSVSSMRWLSTTVCRVTFSEEMANNADLADPTNYTIVPVNDATIPSPRIVSVTVPGTPTYVDLNIDPNAPALADRRYRVQVAGGPPVIM